MNISIEDYLRTIYSIYEDQKDKTEGIRSVDIAKELNISKPSVSSMIKKLIQKKLLKKEPYSKIFFTKKGLVMAQRIMHSHRVIEVFLRDILKYDIKKIHNEAHVLEHAFSEESIKRLDRHLKCPLLSPHGKKIPRIKKR